MCTVGDDSAAESDASSLSDYDESSDPMDHFTVTALPAAAHPISNTWHSQHLHQQPQQQLHQQYESQQQLPQQQRNLSEAEYADDSAHNGRHMRDRVDAGAGEGSGSRADLSVMRGRADSAHEMPVSLISHVLFQDCQERSISSQKMLAGMLD